MTVSAAGVLDVSGVRRTYVANGNLTGSNNFTLTLDRLALRSGERIVVTGPSGCGKSTLLALLAGALRPDEGGGRMLLLDGDLLALWQGGRLDALARMRSSSIGFVPQTASLLPFLTVRDNIALPLAILGRSDPARVSALAQQLGLTDQLNHFPAQLSVGQRQRAAIGRALVHRPAIVLADEPTASVHPAQADAILALLTDEAARAGAAIVLVSHDGARAEASGYAPAPCRPAQGAAVTHFAHPPA